MPKSLLYSFLMMFVMTIFAISAHADAPLQIEINQGIEAESFETGDVNKRLNSSFVETITQEQIKTTHSDLGQIIEQFSGIKIRQSGGTGSYALASIRGKSADQIMIYVDGVLLNSAAGGGVDLSLIPVNQISSIEIYKDSIPVEFAEASNGGVINIKTRRQFQYNQIQAAQMVGSFQTVKTDLQGQFGNRDLQYNITFGQMTSENDFPFINENGTPNNPEDDKKQNRQNNQLSQYNVLLRAKKQVKQHQQIIVQAELFNKTIGLPAINNNSLSTTNIARQNVFLKTKYINNRLFQKNIQFNFQLNHSKKNMIYDNRDSSLGLSPDYMQYNTKNINASLYFKLKRQNYQLTSNSSLRRETLAINDLLKNAANRENKRLTFSTAIQSDIFSFNRRLIFSPGARFQLTQDTITGLAITNQGVASTDESSYQLTSPQFGMRYMANDDLNIKFNISQYYRLPSYIELFGSRGYIGANESLKPEQGTNTDLGFEYQKYPRSSTLTSINWEAALFYSEVNNEIIYTFNSRGEGRPNNAERSTITGLENNIAIELFYNFMISNQFSILSPIHYTATNRRYFLPGRPLLSVSTKLSYSSHSMELYIEHMKDSQMYFDTVNRLPANDKEIINIGSTFKKQNYEISASVTNLNDKRYKDYYFQVSPGRSFQVSLKLVFT